MLPQIVSETTFRGHGRVDKTDDMVRVVLDMRIPSWRLWKANMQAQETNMEPSIIDQIAEVANRVANTYGYEYGKTCLFNLSSIWLKGEEHTVKQGIRVWSNRVEERADYVE